MFLFIILLVVIFFGVVAAITVLVALRIARLLMGTSIPSRSATTTPIFLSRNFENQSSFSKSPAMTIVFSKVQRAAVLSGAIGFHLLFWGQIQGVNLLLWYAACAGFLLWQSAEARQSRAALAVALGGLLAAVGVAMVGSGVAKLAVWTSLALLVGFANQPTVQLLHHALLTGATNVLLAVGAWVSSWRQGRLGGSVAVRRAWYYGRLLGLPLVAVVVFHVLFAMANPRYAALAEQLLNWIGDWLARLFVDFSVQRFLFLLFGAALAAGTLLRVPVRFWLAREADASEYVQRRRPARLPKLPDGYRRGDVGPLGLRKEYLAALAALVLVNGLLLVENILDIQGIWINFRPAPNFDLAQFVHEGTWALIASILLAMALVLYFFRGNLNFYASALRRLRPLATVWIAQNAVLAASVGLRNYHYITRMGLAYKRIGVCFFLVLVAFGLLTVAFKVWQRRSAFSLVRLNSWAAYAVLLLLALGNWEIWIARYNLQPQFEASLDQEFLLTMPPRVLPELVTQQAYFSPENQALLNTRRQDFLALYPERGWLSWNWADARTYRALSQATQ